MSTIHSGIPQGSILGPLLFLLYINDITSIDAAIHFILYADDTTALIKCNSSNVYVIQQKCDLIASWFLANLSCLNVSKTHCMFFTHKCNVNPPNVYLYKKVINYVCSTKFLGCIIDDKLNWSYHISYVCQKVAVGVALLTVSRSMLPFWVKQLMYNAFVYPHLMYCIAVWGNAAQCHIHPLMMMQKRAIWILCNAHYLSHC